MRYSYFLLFFIVVCFLSGCKTRQEISTTPLVVTDTDSTRVEIVYKERIVRDTVTVEIPMQTSERTTLDSVSHLENDYAVSDARINADGSLSHTLSTKSQPIAVPVEAREVEKEKIVYRDKTKNKIVEVEKKLSRWQEFRLRGFWWLLGITIISCCFWMVKFRF